MKKGIGLILGALALVTAAGCMKDEQKITDYQVCVKVIGNKDNPAYTGAVGLGSVAQVTGCGKKDKCTKKKLKTESLNVTATPTLLPQTYATDDDGKTFLQVSYGCATLFGINAVAVLDEMRKNNPDFEKNFHDVDGLAGFTSLGYGFQDPVNGYENLNVAGSGAQEIDDPTRPGKRAFEVTFNMADFFENKPIVDSTTPGQCSLVNPDGSCACPNGEFVNEYEEIECVPEAGLQKTREARRQEEILAGAAPEATVESEVREEITLGEQDAKDACSKEMGLKLGSKEQGEAICAFATPKDLKKYQVEAEIELKKPQSGSAK